MKLEQESIPPWIYIAGDAQKLQMLSAAGFCEVSDNCSKDCGHVGYIFMICDKIPYFTYKCTMGVVNKL